MFRANCYPRWHLTPTINSHNGAVWSIVFGVVTLLYEERKIGLKAHRHICAAALSIKGHSAVANDQLVCGDAHRIAAYERSCPIINHTYDNTWWVYFWTYTVLSICLIRHIYGVLVSHHQLHIDANEVTVRTNDASAPLSIINVAQALIYTLYSKDKQRQQQQQQSGRKKLFIAYASGHRSNRHRASPPWHGFINWIKLITSLVCVCIESEIRCLSVECSAHAVQIEIRHVWCVDKTDNQSCFIWLLLLLLLLSLFSVYCDQHWLSLVLARMTMLPRCTFAYRC